MILSKIDRNSSRVITTLALIIGITSASIIIIIIIIVQTTAHAQQQQQSEQSPLSIVGSIGKMATI